MAGNSEARSDEKCAMAEPCEHYWASHSTPKGCRVDFVRRCMLCPEVDHADLDAQVDAAVAEAQRKVLLSLADVLDHEADAVLSAKENRVYRDAAEIARQQSKRIPDPQPHADPPAEQAHPASSPAHTAAGGSGPVQPGTEGSEHCNRVVSAAQVPDEAVRAAAEAFHAANCPGPSCATVLGARHLDRARAALEAAAPIIRADEWKQASRSMARATSETMASRDKWWQRELDTAVADERERIAKLAEGRRATYRAPCTVGGMGTSPVPFADLIREQS